MNDQIRKDKSLPKACRTCNKIGRNTYSAACSGYADFGCGLFFEQHPETKCPPRTGSTAESARILRIEPCALCSGTGELRGKTCPSCAGHGTATN